MHLRISFFLEKNFKTNFIMYHMHIFLYFSREYLENYKLKSIRYRKILLLLVTTILEKI